MTHITLGISFPTLVDNIIQTHLAAAFRHLLRPMVRIWLRHGMAYADFAEIAKSAFVDVAGQDFAMPGRKASDSRVAILTGMTRKEVRRQRDALLAEKPLVGGNLTRTTRVLEGWFADPDFIGPYGIPLELKFDEGEASFTELVRRYSGDMPARAMLEELIRVGSVEETPEGDLKAITRLYVPQAATPDAIKRVGVVLHDLAATLEHNLNPKQEKDKRFERRVYTTDGVTNEDYEEFAKLLNEKGHEFLVIIDNWITAREKKQSQDLVAGGEKRINLGVELYSFIQELEKE